MKPNIISERLFLNLLKSLQGIVYNEIPYKLMVVKFLLCVLDIIGYKLNFDTCDNCGMKFVGDIKFDVHTGAFRCSNCSDGFVISKQDFVSLKIIQNSDFDKIKTIKVSQECLSNIFDLLVSNLSNRLNCKFKSLR